MGWLWWADRATTTPLGRHICNRCEATGDSALFINGCCDGLGLHPAQRVAKASCCRGAKNDPTLAHTHILGKGQTHGTFLNGTTGI